MKTIYAMTKKEYMEYLISVFEKKKFINNYFYKPIIKRNQTKKQ